MVSSSLEIAVGQTPDTARQFLQATSWKLGEAIQLFYVGSDAGAASLSPEVPPLENEAIISDQSLGVSENHMGFENIRENNGIEVRAPLPTKRDIPYDTPMLYGASRLGVSPNDVHTSVPLCNFGEESRCPAVWEADQGSTSTAETSRDNLASLYRPPFAMMYHGPFENAKEAANAQDRWLMVNVQSTREFSLHMLNRDTWANEPLAQAITSNFIFWQLDKYILQIGFRPRYSCYRPYHGSKNALMALNDPTRKFVGDGANGDDEEMRLARELSMGTMKDSDAIKEVSKKEKVTYPPLPGEPKGDRSLLCRVGVRLPDGRRLQRNFLRSDLIQLLWSFCATNCGDEKPFRVTHAIPGAVKDMDYDSTLSFDESGLSNSMISVTWGEV